MASRLLLALYRAALWLLPPTFRRSWGVAMVREARLIWREAGDRRRRIRAALALAGDLLSTAAREWRDVGRGIGSPRGARPLSPMGPWTGELRATVRALARSPGFTVAAVLTLGLGVGANAAVFTLVEGVLLTPLGYVDADELVQLWPEQWWSRRMLDMAESEGRGFAAVAGWGGVLLTLQEGGEPVELFGSESTPNLFGTLGVSPALGRAFTDGDARPGADPVAVLSHELWTSRFGGDPAIVGTTVRLGGEGHTVRTVVGVMPAGYRSLNGPDVAFWIPITSDPGADVYADSYGFQAVGRLADGAGLEAARAEVERLAARLHELEPGQFSEEEADRATAVPLRDALIGDYRLRLLLVFGGVGVVLLVGCANLANLVLARTHGRERELSLRAALGAGRSRIVAAVLLEAVLSGLGGGLLGLGIAWLGTGMVVSFRPGVVPPEGLGVGGVVFAFSLTLGIGSAVLAGLFPALRVARRDPSAALSGARGGGMDRATSRVQGGLVTAQLALATVLVFGAGLLARSVHRLEAVDPGFEPHGLLAFRISAPPESRRTDDAVLRYFAEVQAAIGALPEVAGVGFVGRLPLAGGTSRITVVPEGFSPPPGAPVPEADHRLVTPGYLETLGATLLEGRWVTADDNRPDAPLARGVVNRAFALAHWPGESPVGKRLVARGGVPWFEVAGMIDDIREGGLDRPAGPAVYVPHQDWAWTTMYGVVRVRAGDPLALEPRVGDAVRSVEAGVPVTGVRTMDAVVASANRDVRQLALLAGVFGALALTLGVLGVWGVVAYTVGRRRHDLGVRAALGASRTALLGHEIRHAIRSVAAGLLMGSVAALAAGRLLRTYLFDVAPSDPATLGAVGVVLLATALVAAWIPARRGVAVDPVEALRVD